VTLYPGKAVVSGVIPIDNGALRPLFPDAADSGNEVQFDITDCSCPDLIQSPDPKDCCEN
jgi:hypothetical protein